MHGKEPERQFQAEPIASTDRGLMNRLLLLSNLYPSVHAPTRGTFNLQGFRALSQYCETQIVVPVLWWERARRPLELLAAPRSEATGIPAVYPSCWHVPQLHRLHPTTMYASVRPYVHRLHREHRFDAILASWACPDGVAAARLAEELDLPLVTMVLGTDVNTLMQHPQLRGHLAWGLRQAARVITVSAALKERVAELGAAPERVLVQHNGVDGERFCLRDRNDERASLGLPTERRLITYVGNLVPEKGVDLLVEALGHLHRSGADDVELLLIGAGPQEETLRCRAAELGLRERIRFAGRRPHEEIARWIAAADVFCLPSRREGCPNVVLEALACGRPVVAARVGGVPELISAETGVLVAPEDPTALAIGLHAALARSWQPEALRASVPCLSWDQFGRTLYEAVRSAHREHPSRSARGEVRSAK